MVSLRSCFLFLTLVVCSASAESAWNGHTTPGSTDPNNFHPYYVAPGTKGYDSGSRLVHYSGKWQEKYSSQYAHKSVHATSRAKSYVTFTFTGTGVEWFGNMDKRHGIADVYVDGKLMERVDTWSAKSLRQQRLYWTFDLSHGKHTVKIVNSGEKRDEAEGTTVDVDAFVVTAGTTTPGSVLPASAPSGQNDAISSQDYAASFSNLASSPVAPQWTLSQKGTTGVHAMQLAIISQSHALIVDKVEHNPLSIDGHPAWAALYNLRTHSVKPLRMQSNSFCAGGTFLSNGTLINVGGNPVVENHTSAADFGDVDGLQAIRVLEPCDSDDVDNCEMVENHSRLRMASPRWYNTVIRISDGSAMIIGGSKKGGWINNSTTNNPTVEYFPPKDINGVNGLPITLPFLVDTLNSNLFPIAFSLPDGRVFMAANNDAMIYDWKNNVEHRLPQIPTATGYEISSQDPASSQCSRMVLTDEGVQAGWQVEQMPQARTMPDAVLLPTGKVLIVNGAGSGISGYGNVVNQVGASNADNPDIPRLYHSVATMTPSGMIMVAGSNPNLDRSEMKYGTEYRVEWLSPPYMAVERPETGDVPRKIRFGRTIKFEVRLPSSLQGAEIKVALMDFGYVTHAVHANSRLVYLESSVADGKVWQYYPPGPGWLVVLANDVPSEAVKVMVGDGKSPEVNEGALQNLLAHSSADQYDDEKHHDDDGSEYPTRTTEKQTQDETK
ncbi:copper radical oxidase [Irpex lacteus]|nr:copper radical oxidase [Irpex lacteus]